jgi:hypothetical protein
MSLVKRTLGRKRYWYLKLPGPREIYLGPESGLDARRVKEAIEYVRPRVEHYSDMLYELEGMLPEEDRRRLQEIPRAGETLRQQRQGTKLDSLPLSLIHDILKLDEMDISLDQDRLELRGKLPKYILDRIRKERIREIKKRRNSS